MPIDIGGYRCDSEPTPVGNGQVARATQVATGRTCFLKVFDKYLMPTDEALATGHAAVRRRKARFEAYERRLQTINERLRTACGSTGGLVCATDLFRDGCRLVKVTDYVDFDNRPASEVHEAYARDEIDQVFRSALTSVQTLHGQGIVHADIKPENIFICRQDGALVGRVSDFDDSFFADEVPDACDVTSSFEYYSPELGRYVRHAENPDDPLGKGSSRLARAVGRTHDIFALGLVLHLYLTGSLPRVRGGEGYVFEALLAHGDEGIELDRGLAPRDAALIRWMLRCDPARRPQTCAQVLNALNADGRGIPAVRVPVAADDGTAPLGSMEARLVLHGVPAAQARGNRAGRAVLGAFDVSPDSYDVQVEGVSSAGRRVRAERQVKAEAEKPVAPLCFHFAGGRARVDETPLARPAGGSRAAAPATPAATHGTSEPPASPTPPAAAPAPASPAPDEVLGLARSLPADVVFDPPRDGRYAALTRVDGDRVLIRLADGTVWRKPLRELALYGMRDCIARLEDCPPRRAAGV